MGRALFSQSYATPAIHDNNDYAPENPLEKAGYSRWSITNPFDPDSEEFFSNAQTERFLEPEELTERQVVISSTIPPSEDDPSLSLPRSGSPITDWTLVGPDTWARTVRRLHPGPNPPALVQMETLDLSGSSGTPTPRSVSPQTPDPTFSPTLPDLVPSDELLRGLPPPATRTTITPTTPSLLGTISRRRQLGHAQTESDITSSPSPSNSSSWTRPREEDDSQTLPSARRTRLRLDTSESSANAPTSQRWLRRARTRSLGSTHQHPESLIPGRNPHSFFGVRSRIGDDTQEGGRTRTAGLEHESTHALLRRLLERSDRTRDLLRETTEDLDPVHLARLYRERDGLMVLFQERVAELMSASRPEPTNHVEEDREQFPEPFIPEPETLHFAAL